MKRKNLESNSFRRTATKNPVCDDCNRVGTRTCVLSCHCLDEYSGTWCESCVDPRSYSDPSGKCLPCPCSAEVSTGECYFDNSRQTAVCRVCLPGYAGLLCDTCEINYHKNTTTGLCEAGFSIKESLSEEISLSYSRRFIVFSSVGVPIVLAVTLALLYLTYRCLTSRSNTIRSAKLAKDPRSNTAEVDEITFSTSKPSVIGRMLNAIGVGRNKAEDRFLLSDYSLQDRHYSLFDEPSDDVFDSEFEHFDTVITHPSSCGPSRKAAAETTRIFENPLASTSLTNVNRQRNGVNKIRSVQPPPPSTYQSCVDVTVSHSDVDSDVDQHSGGEPEMQWDEELNGVHHDDYPFDLDSCASTNTRSFATPMKILDNGNQTMLMSNGTRVDAHQCSPKPMEREAASFYFLASDGTEPNGNALE